MEYWKKHTDRNLVSGDEVFITSVEGVALYDGDVKTKYCKGKLSLSTYHIFYQSEGEESPTILRLALEDIHRTHETPTVVKGFAFSSDKVITPLPAGKYCKLSFKKGGMAALYDRLLEALQDAAWKRTVVTAARTATGRAAGATQQQQQQQQQQQERVNTSSMIGIAGVMKASQESSKLNGTFSDIDDVMDKASTLVSSIRHMKQRSGGDTGNDAAQLESIEATLGLGTLVTSSGVSGSKQAKFHAELGAELHAWMTHPSNTKRFGEMPVVPLVELFALYNRARGGDLVSPEDVLHACTSMAHETYSRYTLEKFSSGEQVLMSKDRSIVLSKLTALIGPRVVNPLDANACISSEEVRATKGISPVKTVSSITTLPSLSAQLKSVSEIQLASVLLISVSTAKEVLERLERAGYLSRCDTGFGCNVFHWNIFVLA